MTSCRINCDCWGVTKSLNVRPIIKVRLNIGGDVYKCLREDFSSYEAGNGQCDGDDEIVHILSTLKFIPADVKDWPKLGEAAKTYVESLVRDSKVEQISNQIKSYQTQIEFLQSELQNLLWK
jgi:hypothetical protein